MKLRRRRDTQQWVLDHLVKTTGRVRNFPSDARQLPPSVKSYSMISKIVGQESLHAEALARTADQTGPRAKGLREDRPLFAPWLEAGTRAGLRP